MTGPRQSGWLIEIAAGGRSHRRRSHRGRSHKFTYVVGLPAIEPVR